MTPWAAAPLSDVEALMWSLDREPRLRPAITAVAFCSGRVGPAQLRHRLERAGRVVPRLRQRIVSSSAPGGSPQWEIDPEFTLSHHYRVTDLGGNASRRSVEELAAEISAQPFDRSRPQWELTLVDGLAYDENAVIFRAHHVITDGLGGVALLNEIFDTHGGDQSRVDELPAVPTAPSPQDTTQVRSQEFTSAVTGAATLIGAIRSSGDNPEVIAHRLGSALGPLARATRAGFDNSRPQPSERTDRQQFASVSIPLHLLADAGRRIGGTINDAFVAGSLIGVDNHHRRNGHPLDTIRIAVPVSTRNTHTVGGNAFVPVPVEISVARTEPDAVMRAVRHRMTDARTEARTGLGEAVAGLARLMPAPATTAMVSTVSRGLDMAVSNIPGSPTPLFLCGRPVQALTPFGPLSGTGINISLLSNSGIAHIGLVVDTTTVPDATTLAADVYAGLHTVIGQ